MNTALWIIQGLLATIFIMPGLMKLTSSKEKIIERTYSAPGSSVLHYRLLGLVELLGVVGIIVPWLTGILPVLTPITAVGFAIVMIGAFVVHYKQHDYKSFPLLAVILVFSVVVAYYRFRG